MKIFLHQHFGLSEIEQYFDFNRIEYKKIDLWDPNLDVNGVPGRYTLTSQDLLDENILLCMTHEDFVNILALEYSKKELLDFCNKNYVWLFQWIDGVQTIKEYSKLLEIDSLIRSNAITIFLDGIFLHNNLKNIKCQSFRYNVYMKIPRITNAQLEKKTTAKDFLLTSVIRKRAPHRKILWEELNKYPGLLNQNNVNFTEREKFKESFIGEIPGTHVTAEGKPDPRSTHPCMDLYRDSFLEIVPETFGDNVYYYTEKTNKPIATKTPFIMVTTPGYLQYLHSLGFQTFSSLISEKYDQEYNVESRVKMLVNVLMDIIKNDSASFYRASKDILDHNHKVLAEMTGMCEFELDNLITKNLEAIGYS